MNEISNALNIVYEAEGKLEQKGPWTPRASGCGGCLREMAHLAAGFVPRPPSPESLRVFELGHQRGAELGRRLKAIWPDAMLELDVRIRYPGSIEYMSGHVDAWIPSTSTIVDFKTTGAYKAGLLLSGLEGPGEEYELQLQAYRHGVAAFAGIAPQSIKCLLVYEVKDSDARKGVTAGQFLEVEVPWTSDLEARFQLRLAALGALVRDQAAGTVDPLAAPGMPKGHWKCKTDAGGRPLYCRIGPTIGKCHQ